LIRRILLDDFDSLVSVLEDFIGAFERKFGVAQSSLTDQVRNALSKNRIDIFGLFNDEEQAIGFVVTQKSPDNPIHGTLKLLHVQDSLRSNNDQTIENSECQLFDTSFEHLRASCRFINVEIPDISETLIDHAVSSGFRKIARSEMQIERSQIESLPEPVLPQGFSLVPWKSQMLSPVARLIAEYSENSVDNELYPEFEDVAGCEKFIQKLLGNSFGEFDSQLTRVLGRGDDYVGVCFLVREKVPRDTGFIPEIGISHSHRRRGLGRALITHSLLHLVKTDPGINRVTLSVTLANTAAVRLYESLGFRHIESEYALIWRE